MEEKRSQQSAVTANNSEPSKVDVTQAKRKRMMLSEVYVHKCRKVDPTSNPDKFEVFHIYEFDDHDSSMKITPKLSTNCTEPRKIIEVLQNSTGSDTPQLKRLIEKLWAQNKKWTEIKQTESKRISTPNSQSNDVNGNDSIPKAVSTGTGVGTNTNTESSALPIMPTVRSQTSLAGAQTITTSAASNAHKPMIRVKAIESMKEANRPNAVNTTKLTNISTNGNGNAPKIVNSVKVVNSPVVQISTATVQKPNKETSDQSTPIITEKSDANQPVKLWNNVMQRKVDKPLDYLVVSNKEDANRDNAVFCIKPTEELIENAKENGSVLKIDQVYECVSDEFVEDLLVERTARPSSASHTSPSPLLDTLVNEVQNIITSPKPTNNQTEKTSERKLTFASPSDEDCSDYRCNVCLRFNQTFAEYKIHMMKSHFYSYVCEKCRDVFKNRNLYYDHLDSKMKCVRRENSSRAFVCIVDPPVILMRNSKVFAFRCRHCNVAFHNQRNYVQHAQRHAKLFRCKICPSAKTMSAPFMQRHLGQHKP